MIAVDTNVLIYACDQADAKRQKVAHKTASSCGRSAANSSPLLASFTSRDSLQPTPGIVSPSSGISCLWFCPATASWPAPRNFISCGKRRSGTR